MSLQATLARAELRHWDGQWRDHKQHCAVCMTAARKRWWDKLCTSGQAVFQARKLAAGALKAEQEADRAPIPGSETLF